MAKKVRTHIIPQFYLRGFTEDESHIWNYDRSTNKVFSASLRDTAVEKKFYSQETEDYVSDNIESPASVAIRSIINRELLSEENKSLLLPFIINLILRVPYGKDKTYSIFPKAFEQVFSEANLDKLKQTMTWLSEAHIEKEFWRQKEIWENHKEGKFTWTWEQVLRSKSDHFPKLFTHLPMMCWQLFIREMPPFFIASKNPIFYPEKPPGIAGTSAEITLPLSKNVALWITWHQGIPETYVNVTDEVADEINHRTASNSDWLYGTNNSSSLELLGRKELRYTAKRIITTDGINHIVSSLNL